MNTIILFYVETSLVIDITYNVYYYTYLYMYISIENRFGVNKLERKLIFSRKINKLKGIFFYYDEECSWYYWYSMVFSNEYHSYFTLFTHSRLITRFVYKSNATDVTRVAGNTYFSRATQSKPGFRQVRVTQSVAFCVVHCG
jgi:hypothetical protein